MTQLSEEELVDRAVSALGVRRSFRTDGRKIDLAILVRTADWRPLDAPWWRGKKVCVIAADLEGNFFLRHCDGTVRYWCHSSQAQDVVAPSVREFVQRIGV
jgi:hypothetical protein